MAKYSVPGIRFTEIDNTIRAESDPGLGIGAIVMASNKGPVNQRVVTKNYNEFTEIFGKPETLESYGHFAAENYFANSNQLFAVRATMGDEQYAQIQYSYRGAPVTATNQSIDTAKLTYVDKEADNNLVLLQPLSAVTVVQSMISGGDWQYDGGEEDPDGGQYGFALKQKAYYNLFSDFKKETEDLIVFKGTTDDGWKGTITEEGVRVIYPTSVDVNGNDPQLDTKLNFSDEGWESSAAPESISIVPKGSLYNIVSIDVPASATLDKECNKITFYSDISATSAISGWTVSGVDFKDVFKDDYFLGDYDFETADPATDNYGIVDAQRMEIMDWDQPDLKKTYYVDSQAFEDTCAQAFGIKYTEWFNIDSSYAIVGKKELDEEEGTDFVFCSAVSAMYTNKTQKEEWLGNDDIKERTPREVIVDMMDSYGCNDISDINDYYYMKYHDVFADATIEKIVKERPDYYSSKKPKNPPADYNPQNFREHVEEYLFWLYSEKGTNVLTKESVYLADDTELVKLPIQAGYTIKKADDEYVTLNNIVASPTSFLVNSVDKTYADGYTVTTDAEDEPGIGDIERYNSVFADQLVIASIGPGEYGNDIGVSIITTECENIPALHHQNAFQWKDKYDDEDQIKKDTSPYNQNPLNLIWKKVFRINVYVKTKTQTAEAAWGTGMDALLKDPAESWWVSTDPYAKDGEGNSLYAPVVINGHSDYIYVSRSSASAAANKKGEYVQPNQTFAIYNLTGGKNSTKNTISEKAAALNFYNDRQRAKFDILFNVDAVDTFNGRQKYNALQRKIAQIAASRTQDIGVVQVTSKAAKTAKQMISEAKNFSFNKGDYVAEYGGYDKYYNSDLAAWIYLPKSVAGACSMAYCDNYFYPWMAPAGVERGTINYTNGQLLRLTDDEIGQLYDNNVNTTRDCGGYGVVLWGQRTALKKNSLLNRINVRRCLNYIEKILENKMTPYLFMQNSVNTRSSARNDIRSFLERVKAAEGIYDFDLSVTADPDDPTIMNVAIQIQPTSAIEFIDIKIIVNRQSGVTVAEE